MLHVRAYSSCCNPAKKFRISLAGNEDIEAIAKQFQTTITAVFLENPKIGHEHWNGLEKGKLLTVTGRYCGEVPDGGAKRFWEVIE